MAKKTTRQPARTGKTEANKYDKIFKENLQALLPALIRKVLKINILRMENLPAIRLQTTKEAEPDFLKKVFTEDHPEGCILQIELEAKDDKKVDAKSLYYVAAEHLKFRLPVDLRMIYLPRGRPKHIKGEVSFFGLKLSYPVYCLSEISYRDFLYSEVPEEVVISILADPEELSGDVIVRLILERLVSLQGDSGALRKFINQLKILSFLRNLHDETIKNVRDMVISKEFVKAIQKDDAFILGEERGLLKGIEQGIEKGMEKGIEQGLEQGLEKGLEEGKLQLAIFGIRNMAKKGFEVNVIAELLGVTEAFVQETKKQLEKEPQILEALAKPRASVTSVAKKLAVSRLLVQVVKETLK